MDFNNLSHENAYEYFIICKLGKILFDLKNSYSIEVKISSHIDNDDFHLLYLSQVQYIHIKEAIKFLSDMKERLDKYISIKFKNSTEYKCINNELNFDNKISHGSRFIKYFRDNTAHYNSKSMKKDLELFEKLALEYNDAIKNDDQVKADITIETVSVVMHMNLYILSNEISVEEYSETAVILVNSIVMYINEILHNMINTLEQRDN